MTSLSLLTLFLISSFVSVPELSTSIIAKTRRAARDGDAQRESDDDDAREREEERRRARLERCDAW